MEFARAIIAAVLATGLVVIVVLQEIATRDDLVRDDGLIIDGTFALLLVAIIILVVPDAIAYFKRKKGTLSEPASEEKDDEVDTRGGGSLR